MTKQRTKVLQVEVTDLTYINQRKRSYAIRHSKIAKGLKGQEHNDDVPAHRFQAATWEPQATRRGLPRNHHLLEQLRLKQKHAKLSTGTQQDLVQPFNKAGMRAFCRYSFA